MPKPKKMTKTQAIHWSYAVDAHRMLEYDLHSVIKKDKMLPPGWDEIWRDIDRRDPKRVPVTIRLDADVVRFFKGMGGVSGPDQPRAADVHALPAGGDYRGAGYYGLRAAARGAGVRKGKAPHMGGF